MIYDTVMSGLVPQNHAIKSATFPFCLKVNVILGLESWVLRFKNLLSALWCTAMVTFTKKSMVERCLIAASLAALVCHPSSTIKCFKPKPRPRSPQKQKPEDPSASPPKGSKRHGVVIGKEVPSKPKEKPCPKAASSSSSASKSRKSTKTKAEKPINLISELVGGDPSIGVVESIIRSGWVGEVGLRIEKVLRVHQSLDVLHGFEE